MWLGPAPWAPYHPYRCSGSYNINGSCWRSYSDYSGGGMTDWVRTISAVRSSPSTAANWSLRKSLTTTKTARNG